MGAISRTSGGTTFGVSRIVNHPSYNSNTLANDISLLETSSNVATTGAIAPAALGSGFVGGGISVIASGWGQTSNPGSAAANLQWVTLSTLTNADCRARFSVANAARVFDNTICTFTRAGQGTCVCFKAFLMVSLVKVIFWIDGRFWWPPRSRKHSYWSRFLG